MMMPRLKILRPVFRRTAKDSDDGIFYCTALIAAAAVSGTGIGSSAQVQTVPSTAPAGPQGGKPNILVIFGEEQCPSPADFWPRP